MTKLVIDGKVCEDVWTHLTDEQPLGGDKVTVSFSRWQQQHSDIEAGPQSLLGVRLGTADDPLILGEQVHRFALIVLEIDAATDGRFFSIAGRLRESLGYEGELRATGDVLVDQLGFMQRCGINAYQIDADTDVQAAITRFQHHYQRGVAFHNRGKTIGASRRTLGTEQSGPDSDEDSDPACGSIRSVA